MLPFLMDFPMVKIPIKGRSEDLTLRASGTLRILRQGMGRWFHHPKTRPWNHWNLAGVSGRFFPKSGISIYIYIYIYFYFYFFIYSFIYLLNYLFIFIYINVFLYVLIHSHFTGREVLQHGWLVVVGWPPEKVPVSGIIISKRIIWNKKM